MFQLLSILLLFHTGHKFGLGLVLCYLSLPILVERQILFSHISYFLRFHVHAVTVESSNLLGIDLGLILSFIVDEPIDMEVLDRAHDNLGPLQRDLVLASIITANHFPYSFKILLIAILIIRSLPNDGLNEAKMKE